jgi:4-carboxymuconolactone decarboxylase
MLMILLPGNDPHGWDGSAITIIPARGKKLRWHSTCNLRRAPRILSGGATCPTEDTMADNENQRRGAAVRRQLLGEAWVEQTSRTTYADPVMRKFIDTVTETVFGALWTRPGLDLKTRTLICVVSDAATAHEAELAIHLRMALRQGWTEEELSETLLHLLGYVGAPATRDAMLVASKVFAEVRAERQ